MKGPEILAPVGDWQMLRAAVHNGADAVYIGMPGFNARGRAVTLDLPELKAMIDYAHLYGVRALLACNILIFERELPEITALLSEVIPLGPDALIVQDIGLVNLIKELSPEQVVHASTQMTVTNSLAIQLTKDLGMKRYVLGREVSLKEMEMIRSELANHPEIELEVFVHGALCVSYSGQCLTSESLGGRSANRGQCAQSCRLPYSLIVDGKETSLGSRSYLVSPKDLCSLDEVGELLRIGIDSFKIEGRLKSPAYVASTARAYRQEVDRLTTPTDAAPPTPNESAARDLQKIYSRGFFSGWMHGVDHQRLVDARYSSHFGLEVGSVSDVKNPQGSSHRVTGGKDVSPLHASYVEVLSTDPIFPGDGLLFLDLTSQERCGAKVYSVEELPSHRSNTPSKSYRLFFSREFDLSQIHSGARVFINSAPALEGELESSFTDRSKLKKIPLSFDVEGSVGIPLVVTARDPEGNTTTVQSATLLAPAQRAPLDESRITEELASLGGSVYRARSFKINITGSVFLHNRELKEIRRSICEQISTARTSRTRRNITAPPERALLNTTQRLAENARSIKTLQAAQPESTSLSVLVRDIAQIEALDGLAVDTVYLDFEFGKEYAIAAQMVREQGKRVAIATTRILKPGELGHLKVIERIKSDAVLVRNLGALEYFRDSSFTLIGDFSLNISNSLSAHWFHSKGLAGLTPSADLNGEQLLELIKACAKTGQLPEAPIWFEVPIHHYMPAFHMEHCVFAAFLSTGSSYKDCGRPCEKHRVEVKDPSGRYHPLKADAECRNTMFNGAPQSALKMIQPLHDAGVRRFRLEALFETPEQLREKVRVYLDLLGNKISVDSALSSLSHASLAAAERVGVTDGQLYNIRSYSDRKKDFTALNELPVHVDPGLSHIIQIK